MNTLKVMYDNKPIIGIAVRFTLIWVLMSFSGVVRSQEFVKEYSPKNAQEVIEVLEEIMSNPAILNIVILRGFYEFTEYYTGSAISPLPQLPADVDVHFSLRGLTRIRWNPLGGESLDATFLYGSTSPEDHNAKLFMEGVFLTPFDDPDPFSSSKETRGLQDQPSAIDGLEDPVFTGFDRIIDVDGGIVVVHGVTAECNRECIRTDGARVLIANTYLACGDDCARLNDPSLSAEALDFSAIRAYYIEAGLPAGERNKLLNHLNLIEQVFKNYDAAVVDSYFHSADIALAINRGSSQRMDQALIDGSRLLSTSAGGRALSLKVSGEGSFVHNSVLSSPVTSNEALDFVYGDLTIINSFLQGGKQGLELTDSDASLGHTALSLEGGNIDVACDPSFTGDEITTLGFNIAVDDSCDLDGPGDQENTDPGLELPGDGSLIPGFAANSPALDGGAEDIVNGELPCSPTDMLGLPRPQDGNGDGQAQCDVGPVEMQSGEDIGAPQSGAFFDTSRSGEGIFVEMLGSDRAVVYLFSYRPDGTAFWAQGVGEVVGNGVVIPKHGFITTVGPTFGDDFDPADVQAIPFAEMAVSLPGCDKPLSAGALSIEENDDLGFPPLLSRMSRLSQVVSCEGATFGPGFSGSFYDPSHNGEGIIVEVISPTSAVVIWFTYDPEGHQDWVLGVGTIEGTTITVKDAYTQSGPVYGPGFDTNDVVQAIWGDFTLTFDDECATAHLDYASVQPGFGFGQQNMVRLSNLDGVDCGL